MADTPTIQAGGGEGPAELPDTATLPNDAAPASLVDNAPVKTEEIKEAPKVTEPQAAPETKPEAVKTDDLPAQPEKQVISEASEQVKEVQAPEVKAVESSDQVKVVETPEQVKVVETPEQVKVVEAAEQVKVEEASTQNGETTSVQEASKEQGDVAALVLLEDGDWKQREEALLRKIAELEQVENVAGDDALKSQLKVREEEIDLLKARVKNLETQLQAAISKPGAKNQEMIESIKQQHEELLSKARGMIFDKTKMVKNQELQIEALTTQVQSLKDINLITKDLLEIRNQEVKAMEDRLEAMEARFKAEKQRYSMIVQRAETSTNLNGDLKKEYTTQLGLFKELREKYEERVQALVSENARLKETLQVLKESSGLGTSTPSSEPAPQGPSA